MIVSLERIALGLHPGPILNFRIVRPEHDRDNIGLRGQCTLEGGRIPVGPTRLAVLQKKNKVEGEGEVSAY